MSKGNKKSVKIYIREKNFLKILGKEDFNIEHILQCGQFFTYEKTDGRWNVYSADKKIVVEEIEEGYQIFCNDLDWAENFFDLKTDYKKIKEELANYEILKKPIEFGCGIRILKQGIFETLISFIISANNNIKRIQMIIKNIKQRFGSKVEDFYAFPTRQQLLQATEKDFFDLGAGYRAKYLYKVLREIDEKTLENWDRFTTEELRKNLIGLSGVGPKVADCIMLFGYSRGDVFPVDTWINQMYNRFYEEDNNRQRIRKKLTGQFGFNSGYAQQYLFYYMREQN